MSEAGASSHFQHHCDAEATSSEHFDTFWPPLRLRANPKWQFQAPLRIPREKSSFRYVKMIVLGEDSRSASAEPNDPRRAQRSRGAQESPGEPRRAQESPGEPRKAQENPKAPGDPRKAQRSPGKPREPRGAQESPGAPGDLKRPQNVPTIPKMMRWC